MHAGGSVSFTTAVTPINGFTGSVTLTSPGASGGVGLSFAERRAAVCDRDSDDFVFDAGG